MKHTKGPWITQELDRGEIEVWSEGYTCRIGYLNPSPLKEYKANAQLIASAPDMLEATKYMIDKFGGHDEFYQKTLALIAKAEGK